MIQNLLLILYYDIWDFKQRQELKDRILDADNVKEFFEGLRMKSKNDVTVPFHDV